MYIRTKDKIIAFGEKYAYPTRLSNGKTYFSFQELTEDRFEVMKEYNHWEILKQSDTIEELCDEFVGVDNTCENGHQLLRAIPYKCANFWNGGVYGCIWTDKGLIYVAKMNESGELELICQK